MKLSNKFAAQSVYTLTWHSRPERHHVKRFSKMHKMQMLFVLFSIAPSCSTKYATGCRRVHTEYNSAQEAGTVTLEGLAQMAKCTEDEEEAGALHHKLAIELRKAGHTSKAIGAYRQAMTLNTPAYKNEAGLALEYAEVLLSEGVSSAGASLVGELDAPIAL